MKKITTLSAVLIAGLLTLSPMSAALADDSRVKFYAPCAACHLPTGAGIPGAFPPLTNRLATIAALEGGREYLIHVASYGITGMLNINGQMYVGAMPGHKPTMSADEIAQALNYVIFELGNSAASADLEPISAEEVTQVQAAIGSASMQDSATLRAELKAKHADKWPD